MSTSNTHASVFSEKFEAQCPCRDERRRCRRIRICDRTSQGNTDDLRLQVEALIESFRGGQEDGETAASAANAWTVASNSVCVACFQAEKACEVRDQILREAMLRSNSKKSRRPHRVDSGIFSSNSGPSTEVNNLASNQLANNTVPVMEGVTPVHNTAVRGSFPSAAFLSAQRTSVAPGALQPIAADTMDELVDTVRGLQTGMASAQGKQNRLERIVHHLSDKKVAGLEQEINDLRFEGITEIQAKVEGVEEVMYGNNDSGEESGEEGDEEDDGDGDEETDDDSDVDNVAENLRAELAALRAEVKSLRDVKTHECWAWWEILLITVLGVLVAILMAVVVVLSWDVWTTESKGSILSAV